MSATVSAFGHRGTTSSVKTEIVRELVNASDGAGLHFDGAAGSVAFTPVDLGTKFSFEFVLKSDAWLSGSGVLADYLVDYASGGRFVIGASANQTSSNLGIYDNSDWVSFGVAVLDDLKVHHLVVVVDDTDAKLYDNGNEVASATISNAHGLDSTALAAIGSRYDGSQSYFNGNIYRCRTYNKALSSAEVQTAYERSDVPFADQYGSQTAILESDFSSGTSAFTGAGLTVAGNIDSIGGQNDTLRSTIDSSTGNHQTIRGISGTNGKRYRATGKVYIPSANALVDKVVVNNQGDLTNVIATITATDTWTDFEAEFIREYQELRFRAYDGTANSFAGNGSDVFYIKDIKIVPAGCVSDYDLAFANPTQSLTVQDRAGAADGTASTSGVTQVQPVVQGNLTSLAVSSATARTPNDGDVVAEKVGAGVVPVAALHAKTPATTGSSPLEVSRLEVRDEGVNLVAGMGPKQSFFMPHSTGSFEGASIAAKKETATDADESTSLVFSTCPDAGTNTERLTINSTGDVAIGGDGGGEKLYVEYDTDNSSSWWRNQDVGQTIFNTNPTSGAGPAIKLQGANARFVYGSGSTNDSLTFSSRNAEGDTTQQIKFAHDGLATFSNGIAFSQTNTSATGATATGTTLSHFEEGTWTPVFRGSSTAGTYTAGTTVAKYTRIGNLVTVLCSLINISGSGGVGSVYVTGLPFTSQNTGAQAHGTGFVRLRSYTSSGNSVLAYVGNNSAVVQFSQYVSGTSDAGLDISGLSSGSSDLSFSLTYFV